MKKLLLSLLTFCILWVTNTFATTNNYSLSWSSIYPWFDSITLNGTPDDPSAYVIPSDTYGVDWAWTTFCILQGQTYVSSEVSTFTSGSFSGVTLWSDGLIFISDYDYTTPYIANVTCDDSSTASGSLMIPFMEYDSATWVFYLYDDAFVQILFRIAITPIFIYFVWITLWTLWKAGRLLAKRFR